MGKNPQKPRSHASTLFVADEKKSAHVKQNQLIQLINTTKSKSPDVEFKHELDTLMHDLELRPLTSEVLDQYHVQFLSQLSKSKINEATKYEISPFLQEIEVIRKKTIDAGNEFEKSLNKNKKVIDAAIISTITMHCAALKNNTGLIDTLHHINTLGNFLNVPENKKTITSSTLGEKFHYKIMKVLVFLFGDYSNPSTYQHPGKTLFKAATQPLYVRQNNPNANLFHAARKIFREMHDKDLHHKPRK